jgi:uncharacterized membrane protein YhaH (DUF805 family)
VRLPDLGQLKYLGQVLLRRPDPAQPGGLSPSRHDRIRVQVFPITPWHPERFEGLERHFARPAAVADLASAAGASEGLPAPAEGWMQHRFHQPALPPIAYLLTVGSHRVITPLGVGVALVSALAALAFLTYWLSIALWAFQDARRSGGPAFAWGTLVVFTNLVGLAIYLLARHQRLLCPGCGLGVESAFRYCPACGEAILAGCPGCQQPMHREWAHCVHCGRARE